MRTVDQAIGRWPGILKRFGLDDRTLSGNHVPCPVCGGKDRFRFDDKEGRGTYFCSHCGAGNGMDLLMKVTGMGFKEAAMAVDGIVGSVPEATPVKSGQTNQEKLETCRRIWNESRPVVPDDPVHRYLTQRVGSGVHIEPGVIRYHPARHLMALAQGIAEGFETALCAAKRFGIPTWSATSLNRLEAWIPPEGVNKVWIFGDNDTHGGGQRAAWALCERLSKAGIAVEVRIPNQLGTDWAD